MNTVRWVIRWDGHEWSEADLTVAHLMLIVSGHGVDTWDVLPTAGPRRLLSTLAAFISLEANIDFEQVIAALMLRPASDLLEALQLTDSE